MLGWDKRIPVPTDRSTLQVRAGKNDDREDGTNRCNDDQEPLEPFVDAKKSHEQDSDGDACDDGNDEPRCVCKPHPFQDVDHLIRPQAGIVLSEAVMVGNGHKGLRDDVKDLIGDG